MICQNDGEEAKSISLTKRPRLKFWKFLGGEGSSKTPWNGKSWGVGDVNQKVFRGGGGGGGGMDVFWNHTLPAFESLHFLKSGKKRLLFWVC